MWGLNKCIIYISIYMATYIYIWLYILCGYFLGNCQLKLINTLLKALARAVGYLRPLAAVIVITKKSTIYALPRCACDFSAIQNVPSLAALEES